LRFYLCMLLIMAACLFLSLHLINRSNRLRMLQAVCLEEMQGLKQEQYVYWEDFLKYCDGYEIMVFILDGVQWNPPEEWTRVTKDRNIEDIEKQLGIDINNNAVLKLNLGGLSCKSWFYADSGDDCPFEERDFYFACCDETDSDSKKVFIYRGHHLYGI